MDPLNATATDALRAMLAGQPNTAAKVTFGWKIAAGPALARATSLRWTPDGALVVRAASDAWRRELVRARPMLAGRLDRLLGAGVVRTIVIE